MRIRSVRTVLYEYEPSRPIGDVQLPDGARRVADVAVFLTTDEGPVGVGIAGAAARPFVHSLAEELVGHDPREVRGLHELLLRRTFKAGSTSVVGSAIAALDCALWDLRAKHNGVPLWRELGGSSNRVMAYASGLDMPLSDEALRSYYLTAAREHGIRAGKLKVGRDPERDLDRLALMRDALIEGSGDSRPSLMVDANEFWSPKQAIRRIAEMEREFDLVWVEEPVRRDDHRGLARVSRGVRASVATGENLNTTGQFVPLFVHESADIIQVAVQSAGITTSLLVAEMADAFGLPTALVNCPGRFAAHVAAVLPNHLMMEVVGAGSDAVFTSDHHVTDGMIVLGDAPGIGIAFDEEKLAAHAVDRPSAEALGGLYRRSIDSGVREVRARATITSGDGPVSPA